MKSTKFTSTVLALSLIVTNAYASVTPANAIVVGCPEFLNIGDPNEDGVVNSADASFILEVYAANSTGQETTAKAYQLAVADVNRDGSLDSSDASLILTRYAEESTGTQITQFPTAKLKLGTTYTIPHPFQVVDYNEERAYMYEAFTPFTIEGASKGVATIVIGNNGYKLYYEMYTDDICIYS